MSHAIAVPTKRKGAAYSVILRAEGYTLGNVVGQALTGRSDVVPSPELGERCACCDTEVGGRRKEIWPVDPSDKFEVREPVAVPCCAECDDHIAAKTGMQSLLAIVVLTSGAGAYLAFETYQRTEAGILCAAVGVAALLALAMMRRARLADSRGGHQAGLELMAAPKQLVVRTFNRRFAERVVASNRDVVALVR